MKGSDLDFMGLPEHMREGAKSYIYEGYIPGDFLRLIFENDFVHALGHADMINQHAAFEYAKFLYNVAPLDCWGSKEKVATWHEHRGLRNEPWPSKEEDDAANTEEDDDG